MSLKTLIGSGSGSGIQKNKIRIRIRNKSFRIRNPAYKYIKMSKKCPIHSCYTSKVAPESLLNNQKSV